MAHALDAARLKLDRAEEHLRAFDNESGDWLEQTNFREFVDQDSDGERAFFLKITASPPPRLSAILGDCLQNLRASLDYLAWELVLANGQTPSNETYFPISRNVPKPGKQFHPKAVTGMHPQAVAVVEQLQPYYGGQNPDTSLLWFLRELSNTDKHRTINIVVGQVVVNAFRLYMRFGGDERVLPPAWHERGVLHDGAKVASYPLVGLEGGTTLKIEAETLGFLTLGHMMPWGAFPVSRQVEGVWRFIRDDVLQRFEQFFPKA